MIRNVHDKLVALRNALQGRVNHAKDDVRYWHNVKSEAQSEFAKHAAKIHYTHAVRSLSTSFHDLQTVKKLIKEVQNELYWHY